MVFFLPNNTNYQKQCKKTQSNPLGNGRKYGHGGGETLREK